MAALVETITPGRGRPGELVTIAGSGFSPTFGQNQVTFGGIPAGVNVNGEEELQVVAPIGMPVDQHVPVVVTNLDDASSYTWFWWSKDTVPNTDTQVLRTKVPGVDELARGLGRDVFNMNTAEARYFERIATKILLMRDLIAAKGDFASRSADGMRQALAGTAGQPFVSSVLPAGGQFQDRESWTLQLGVAITSTDLVQFMTPGGRDTSAPPTAPDEVVALTGQIAIVSLRERASVTSRINRVELLVNDVVVLDLQAGDDDFPGPGFRNGESLTFYPGLAVSQGDRVRVRVTRNSTTTTCNVLAYLVMV